ncbi:unnamed protein product, partial [marine sediment metagenome]
QLHDSNEPGSGYQRREKSNVNLDIYGGGLGLGLRYSLAQIQIGLAGYRGTLSDKKYGFADNAFSQHYISAGATYIKLGINLYETKTFRLQLDGTLEKWHGLDIDNVEIENEEFATYTAVKAT